MADRTTIEWTDATWNPVTGCVEVSPGCDHCYAKTFAERWRGTPGHYFEAGFDVQLRPERLDQPLRWRRPRRIFVNSMSDLFHADVPDDYIARVFAVMAMARRHTFQVLTKRHGRMRSLLSSHGWRQTCENAYAEVNHAAYLAGAIRRPEFERNRDKWWSDFATPLPNVWLGVSVEDQRWADVRVPALLETPAAVRFLSCEPLLGPVDLRAWPHLDPAEDGCPPIDWVIVGGESGRGARPMHPDWARQLRDQCVAAGTAFTFKQVGEWAWTSATDTDPDAWVRADTGEVARDGDPRLLHGSWQGVWRTGKKAAGRELDGRTHDDHPSTRQEQPA